VGVVHVRPALQGFPESGIGAVQPAQPEFAPRQHQPGFRGVQPLGEGRLEVWFGLPPPPGIPQAGRQIVLGHPRPGIRGHGVAIAANRLIETSCRLQRMRFPHDC